MNISTAGWIQKWNTIKTSLVRPGNFTFEWLIIVLWGLWFSQAYLNMDPYIWPAGYGIGIKSIGHQFWIDVQQCGLCALWSGSINGGHPALADLFGSQFHPLIAIPIFLFGGVVNGLKISLIGINILAGLAQWWIAKELRLGRIARTWSGMMAVVGGHLATQQWEGNLGISLSIASATLVIAAFLSLTNSPTKRKAVILAISGLLLIISGQGYIQAALVGWAPALLFILFNDKTTSQIKIRELSRAVVISILLAGFFLLPMVHFWPNFTKDPANDPTFSYAQPLEYQPLNYLIHDDVYFHSLTLGKPATADVPFIGWIPVFFALLCIRYAKREDIPAIGFLGFGFFITISFASAVPFRWLTTISPYFLWMRNVWVISGLGVPPLLGIASIGLERILQLNWPIPEFSIKIDNQQSQFALNSKWLLIIPILMSIYVCEEYANRFIVTQDMTKMYTQYIWRYKTKTTEWVEPLIEPAWIQPSLDQGFKLTGVVRSGATWAGRDVPPQYLVSVRGELISDKPFEQVDLFDGLPIYHIIGNDYAYISYPDGQTTPCDAHAQGGFINVSCKSDQDGILTVVENSWSGWFVWRDGTPTEVVTREYGNARWLGADAPAGTHTYEFKYIPWDVYLGIFLSIIGIGLSIYFWVSTPEKTLP